MGGGCSFSLGVGFIADCLFLCVQTEAREAFPSHFGRRTSIPLVKYDRSDGARGHRHSGATVAAFTFLLNLAVNQVEVTSLSHHVLRTRGIGQRAIGDTQLEIVVHTVGPEVNVLMRRMDLATYRSMLL